MIESNLVLQVEKAVSLIKEGKLVAFPTETVYCLGADAFNSDAVEKVYNVKGRVADKALPVIVGDEAVARRMWREVPRVAEVLIRNFWPGPLTLVLPKAKGIPDYVCQGHEGVAVRVPSHPIALAISRKLSNPLVGTSANLSGQPSTLTAEEVMVQIGFLVDMIIDGGKCQGGIESTIIDFTRAKPQIVRPGLLQKEVIARVLKIADEDCSWL